MKKLIIILLLCPLFSIGQLYHMKPEDNIPIGKLDTVSSSMLISVDGKVSETNGYIVNIRRKYYNEPGEMCFNCENYWEFVKYLDARKNPLPKNIKVWISRNN